MEELAIMSSRLFVFTDLDDTLFQSAKGNVPEHAIQATVDAEGNTYAYSSLQQQKLLEVLVKAGAVVVPVTGRRSSSFLNCRLPDVMSSDYAIVSHGAVILNKQHRVLEEWVTYLENHYELLHWQEVLNAMYEQLLEHYADDKRVRVRLIVDQGITAYICIKINKVGYLPAQSAQVSSVLNAKLKTNMLLHENGRNFAILAPYAQKKVAVNFLKEKLAVNKFDTVFAMGDSHSDMPFMNDADFLIIPQHAQILKKDLVS